MEGRVNAFVSLVLVFFLLSTAASARKTVNVTFTQDGGSVICVNKSVTINTTDEKGNRLADVQLDFEYAGRKVHNTRSDGGGLAYFTPAYAGTYDVSTEKSLTYRPFETTLEVLLCETTTTTSSTSSSTLTTSTLEATSTLACLYDADCVVCGGSCLNWRTTENKDCELNVSESCGCKSGECVQVTTTTTSTSSVPTTVAVVQQKPAEPTAPVSKTTVIAAAVILVVIVAAGQSLKASAGKQEKNTGLGGRPGHLKTRKDGTTRLERA